MPLVEVELIEEAFTPTEEKEIVTKLIDAIVSTKEPNSPSWLVDLEALWSEQSRR
jgi:phenylpyruvate tautomerase PptA (4-oxalocrotonate tautomerase family)